VHQLSAGQVDAAGTRAAQFIGILVTADEDYYSILDGDRFGGRVGVIDGDDRSAEVDGVGSDRVDWQRLSDIYSHTKLESPASVHTGFS
jgi:hypothetical protein